MIDSRQDARLGQGQRHAPERADGAASQVASRLQQAGVDAIEEAEQGQDHVRDVPVHQAHDHGERSALEPPDRVVHEVDEHEEPVDVPVVVQQVDPGEHPHQVADPERGDQQDEQQALVPAAEAGHVVRDRIAQNETDRRSPRPRRRRCARTPARRSRRPCPASPRSARRSTTRAGTRAGDLGRSGRRCRTRSRRRCRGGVRTGSGAKGSRGGRTTANTIVDTGCPRGRRGPPGDANAGWAR